MEVACFIDVALVSWIEAARLILMFREAIYMESCIPLENFKPQPECKCLPKN